MLNVFTKLDYTTVMNEVLIQQVDEKQGLK